MAAPSFLISPAATLCQAPNDSAANGMKASPYLLQSYPAEAVFLLKAVVKALQGAAAASATVASCRGLMTVTSSVAYFPLAQWESGHQLASYLYPGGGSALLGGAKGCRLGSSV